jgi:HAD superfamily hydrolase (TIGR01509 family)
VSPKLVDDILFNQGLQQQYETGLIDCTQFHQEFCAQADIDPSKELSRGDLLRAISDIFWANRPIFPVLTQLKARGFPMGVLSNTCDAHWQFVFSQHWVLQTFFDPLVLSYEEKSMKPDSKIYEAAIKRAGVEPGHIFFTDDRQENIDAAIKAGIDAVLFETVPQLVFDLQSRGVMINC